jgi:hypothetical protein
MTRRRLHLVSAFFASVALAGCGVTDPYTHNAVHSSTATSAARAGAITGTVTDPSEPAPFQPTTTAASGVTAGTSTSGAATPRQALRLYARLYINWTATTIGAHQRQLAAMSQGTARAGALQAAASYSRDPELERSRVANTGTIVSIAAGQGPQRGAWVIVTSEHTTGQGAYAALPATAHVTYAHLTRTPHGWTVNQWAPQS